MRRSWVILFTALFGVWGCGGAAPIAADNDAPTAQGVAIDARLHDSMWKHAPQRLDSPHPVPQPGQQTYVLRAPAGVRRFRIHFAAISLPRDGDVLRIQDGGGTEIERVSGSHKNYLSPSIVGDSAVLVLETRGARSWGFRVDGLWVRRCVDVAQTPHLTAVASCDDLAARLRTLALRQVAQRFADLAPYGRMVRAAEARMPAGAATPEHSETNVQVEGVDEADLVKTNGQRIYALSGQALRILRAWPARDTSLVRSVPIDGYPISLFLVDNRVVVLSSVYDAPRESDATATALPLRPIAMRPWRGTGFTKVTVIDVSQDAGTVLSETLLAGSHNTARRIGNVLRIVLRRQLNWPDVRYDADAPAASRRQADLVTDELEAEARRTVLAQSLSRWLPTSYERIGDARVALPTRCTDFVVGDHLPMGSYLTVATLQLGRGRPTVQETSLVTDADGQIYASQRALYVAAPQIAACPAAVPSQGQRTHIHQIDIGKAVRADYVASGEVAGAVHDQFSLDEHAGYLRLATTDTTWDAGTSHTDNRVYVLGPRGDRLEIIGQTPPLAPGERIYSARFIGERGFVVTYRQVDPLFTLDLRDPTAPRVVAELKVPGFSTYLHVFDAQHLFAIGNDFDERGETRNGVALSLFDVTDLTAPSLTHKALIGTRHGYSEALAEHHAFTLYRPTDSRTAVLAIPFTDWTQQPGSVGFWQGFTSTLKVFRVSVGGILELGSLDHRDLFAARGTSTWDFWYRPVVRRGVFIGDYVYALSDAGVTVAPIDAPSQTVAALRMP